MPDIHVVFALLLGVCALMAKSNVNSFKCDSKCKCERNGTEVIVTCTNKRLRSLPLQIPENVTVLQVGGNNIRDIPNDSLRRFSKLRELDLSSMVDAGDHSFTIHSNSFRGLESLKVLNMEKVAESLEVGCNSRPFRHIKSLQELRMRMVRARNSSCLNTAFYDFKDMKQLSLRTDNHILPQSLGLMRNLKILDLASSEFKSMDQETFKVLRNISVKVLSLRWVQFDTVDPLALLPVAHSLQALDYSCPRTKNTNPDLFAPILPSFQNSTALRVLNLDSVYRRTDGCLKLQEKQFKPLHHVPIVSLSIRDNALTTVRRFYRYILSVKYLNVDYNPLNFRGRPDATFYIKMFMFTKYQTFSAAYIRLDGKQTCLSDINEEFWSQVKSVEHVEDDQNVKCVKHRPETLNSTLTIKIPLQNLICSHIDGMGTSEKISRTQGPVNVSERYIDGSTKVILDYSCLTKLVCSHSNLRRVDWPMYGLSSVKYLNLEHNDLEFVHSDVFHAFPSLQTLRLAVNRFGLFTNESYLVKTFSNLRYVRKIDLSDNLLTAIPHAMFSNCTSLVFLNLSNNPLITLEFDFSLFPQLSFVDLGDCKIQEFKDYQIDFFQTSSSLKVNVTGLTELDCQNCNNKDFYEMIRKNKTLVELEGRDELTCTRDGARVKLADLDLSRLEFNCMYEIFIIACVTVVFVVLISVVVVLYCRWNIKYLVYLARRKLKNRGDPHANIFEYDLYISSSYEDEFDTAKQLFTGLNNMGLDVFYWPRNSLPGTWEADEIFEHLSRSKKIVVLITSNTETSTKQNFEIHMSLVRGKGFIIPVVTEDFVFNGKLPGSIKHLLRHEMYFSWPEQDEDQKDFWRNLERAARTKGGVQFRRNGCVAYYGH